MPRRDFSTYRVYRAHYKPFAALRLYTPVLQARPRLLQKCQHGEFFFFFFYSTQTLLLPVRDLGSLHAVSSVSITLLVRLSFLIFCPLILLRLPVYFNPSPGSNYRALLVLCPHSRLPPAWVPAISATGLCTIPQTPRLSHRYWALPDPLIIYLLCQPAHRQRTLPTPSPGSGSCTAAPLGHRFSFPFSSPPSPHPFLVFIRLQLARYPDARTLCSLSLRIVSRGAGFGITVTPFATHLLARFPSSLSLLRSPLTRFPSASNAVTFFCFVSAFFFYSFVQSHPPNHDDTLRPRAHDIAEHSYNTTASSSPIIAHHHRTTLIHGVPIDPVV